MTLDPHGGGVPINYDPAGPAGVVGGDRHSGGLTARSFSRAVAWAAGSQLTQQLIQLPITIILSRLLMPRDFGLMAMVLVLSQFFVVFVDAGLGAAVVHVKQLEQRYISTAFWLNIGGGVAIGGLLAGASHLIAFLYDEPRLTWLTVAIAGNFVVTSVGVVPIALLQRRLNMRRIAAIQNGAAVLGGVAGVVGAVLNLGVWSLVIDVLVTGSAQSGLALLSTNFKLSRQIDRDAAR